MSNLLKNIIRFILFILFQVFILDQIPTLHQFIVPYLYFLYILWLPFNMSKWSINLVAFVFGLCLDFFTKTPGLHAAVCTLIAFVRPTVISILMPKETSEVTYIEPSISSMGFMPYAVYVLILTLLHHSYLVLLEWIQFGSFMYFIGKVIGTTGISILLILITEMLFVRKSRVRSFLA